MISRNNVSKGCLIPNECKEELSECNKVTNPSNELMIKKDEDVSEEFNTIEISKVKKQRCSKCKKRISITYDCKCKSLFCLNCLPSFQHNCTFDYKTENKERLLKQNVKIVAPKIDKI